MIGRESLTLVESGAIVQACADGVRVGAVTLSWQTVRDLLRWRDRRVPTEGGDRAAAP